jgi:hypothetical protein
VRSALVESTVTVAVLEEGAFLVEVVLDGLGMVTLETLVA